MKREDELANWWESDPFLLKQPLICESEKPVVDLGHHISGYDAIKAYSLFRCS